MEHVRVRPILIEAPDAGDEDEPATVPTFCLDRKALPAAEQFLLARYTLHEQVYFHKTTRCIEHMIANVLQRVATLAARPDTVEGAIGLERDHPLVRFLGSGEAALDDYLALDDVVVMSAFERMARGRDEAVANLSKRLRDRRLFKTQDIRDVGDDPGRQVAYARRIDSGIKQERYEGVVVKDEDAAVSIYTQIGGDDEKAHKKLHIIDQGQGPVEITKMSRMIGRLAEKVQFTRYYFENEGDRDKVRPKRRDWA